MDRHFSFGKSGIAKGENGLFAKHSIPSGTILFFTFMKNVNVKSIVWEQQYEQSMYNAFINHSDNPNTESVYSPGKQKMYRRSIKNIMPGEEITSEYNQTIAIIKKLGYQTGTNWLWFKKNNLL